MSRKLALLATLALAACSGGKKVSSPPVIRSFAANPASVAPGGEATLSWDVTSDATSLSIDQGVGVVTGTSVAVHPAQTTTYTLTATGPGGASTALATVVTNASLGPVIASFTATPSSIATGAATTLRWSVTNATSLSIDHGVGAVTGSARAVTPRQSTLYTLTATGPGGSVTATVPVTVLPAPALTFSASPATITAGQQSTLSWSSTDATSLSIDHGVGAVTGTTSVAVSPAVTTVYRLTGTGPGGTSTITTTVTVTGTTPAAPSIASFTASPAAIGAGEAATLQWSVTDASALSIDQGVGAVSGASVVVTPSATTTYTLTAVGPGGSATATATVTIAAATGGAPVIRSFTATPAAIATGGSATLTWDVANATSLTLDNGIGAVTGSSRVVSPAATTTYTLTASGAGPAATATATITVGATSGALLVYTDPADGVGKLRLVKNPASTDHHLVLDLQVGAAALNLFGVALTLPLDATLVSFSSSSPTSLGGLAVRGPIDPGSAPAAAAARLMKSGPLSGKLVLGVARKKSAAADGDVTCAPGTTLFSIAFDAAGAATGPVFDGAAPGAGFRARALSKSGAVVAAEADFAIGALEAQ